MPTFNQPIPATSVLLIRPDRKLYVARRADSNAILPGFYEAPTGKSEPDEGPFHTGIRELKEEAGIELPSTYRLLYRGMIHTEGLGPMRANITLLLLELEPSEKPKNTEPSKRSNWVFGTVDAILKMKPLSPTLLALLGVFTAESGLPESEREELIPASFKLPPRQPRKK